MNVVFISQMMELLLPQRNFTISPAVLENRPWMTMPGIRAIRFGNDEYDLIRRSKFSYAVIDMLQITPAMKLSLLQVCHMFPFSEWKLFLSR